MEFIGHVLLYNAILGKQKTMLARDIAGLLSVLMLLMHILTTGKYSIKLREV